MKRILLTFLISILVMLVACSSPAEVQQGSSGDAVFIDIKDNGISSDSSEVVITNFKAGARAEMTYRIHNGTAASIMPEIYLVDDADVKDYSQAGGAVKAPDIVSQWLDIPKLEEIPPGQIKDYTVAIAIPKGTESLPKKFGFQIGVTGNTGGQLQTAVGTWWLASMR